MTYKEWKEKFVDSGEKPSESEPRKAPTDAKNSGKGTAKRAEKKIELSDEEKTAINDYISSSSYTLNEVLRKGEELSESQKEMVKNLDSALDKLPKYKGNLTRSLYFYLDEDVENFVEQHKIDKEKTYSQYLSTTKGSTYNPEGQVQITIQNAENGVDISSINEAEQEVLYKRDVKFVVLSKTKENGRYQIILEEKGE